MDPSLTWNSSALTLLVSAGLDKNIGQAVRLLRDEEKQALSVVGAPIPGKFKKNPLSKKGRKKQLRTPSAPGDPPHKWTGRLRAGVYTRVFKGRGKGKVIVRGGNLTEFGTKNMAARPHLRPTMAKMQSAITAILVQPVIP